MALATLQSTQIPGVNPACLLTLSPTSTLVGSLPAKPIIALYVKPVFGGPHALQVTSAQQLFQYFRPAGPLIFVHTDVDVGADRRTCALEYWDLDDAQYATEHRHSLHSALRSVQMYALCAFYPYGIRCSVSLSFGSCKQSIIAERCLSRTLGPKYERLSSSSLLDR